MSDNDSASKSSTGDTGDSKPDISQDPGNMASVPPPRPDLGSASPIPGGDSSTNRSEAPDTTQVPQQPPAPPVAPNTFPGSQSPPLTTETENFMVLLLVWSPLAALVVGSLPFVNLIGPVIVWYVYKDRNAKIDALGKSVLNFQISFAIYGLIALFLGGLGMALSFLFLPLLLLVIPVVVGLAWLVGTIFQAISAMNPDFKYKDFKMPGVISFIK